MREKLKIEKYYTLYKWIVLGCIALMIPIACAIINFFINKNLVERKIDQVNHFMLQNIQYSIDSKLNDLQEVSKYYLLNQDFALYTLNVKDQVRFLERVRGCHQTMQLSANANSDIEIMLYIKEKEYILGSATANEIAHVYGSLQSQGKLPLSLEEWKKQLVRDGKSGFLISDILSYASCGKENLVHTTPLLYSNSRESGYLFVSMTTGFIDLLMNQETNMGNTILILDRDGSTIGQYGAELKLSDEQLQMPPEQGTMEFSIDGERYVGAYTDSEVADWVYVVCTPERILMEEVHLNRNLNLIIVLIGAVIGVAAVVWLQRRNYRPVQQLMEILPERGADESVVDEFAIVERNLRRLYEENQSMQDSIERRREYDREQGLLSVIKGRTNFYRRLSTEELLGSSSQDRHFAFVTVRLDMEDGTSALDQPIGPNLLSFLIDNVTMDILGQEYRYIKTLDDRMLVYLFILDGTTREGWEKVSMEKFLWLNEFFQNRLESDLSITLGTVFDEFEHVESAYAEIEEANDQRYYTQPYGVVRADEAGGIDFSSTGRLAYYSKRFEEVAFKADFTEGQELSNDLFQELESSGKPFNTMLYYVLSIVNNVLMTSHHLVLDGTVSGKALEEALAHMRATESLSSLKDEYYRYLKLICRAASLEEKDSGRLSESIKAYVKEHYTDCNMNISAIAEEIGITPRYMSKMFKDQTGIGLLNYINDVRIERAKVLLKTTGMTVDEIAEHTGFANSRTFRRNFQKATGVTAVNYKNR